MSRNLILENEVIEYLFNGCIEQNFYKKKFLFRNITKVLLMLEFLILLD